MCVCVYGMIVPNKVCLMPTDDEYSNEKKVSHGNRVPRSVDSNERITCNHNNNNNNNDNYDNNNDNDNGNDDDDNDDDSCVDLYAVIEGRARVKPPPTTATKNESKRPTSERDRKPQINDTNDTDCDRGRRNDDRVRRNQSRTGSPSDIRERTRAPTRSHSPSGPLRRLERKHSHPNGFYIRRDASVDPQTRSQQDKMRSLSPKSDTNYLNHGSGPSPTTEKYCHSSGDVRHSTGCNNEEKKSPPMSSHSAHARLPLSSITLTQDIPFVSPGGYRREVASLSPKHQKHLHSAAAAATTTSDPDFVPASLTRYRAMGDTSSPRSRHDRFDDHGETPNQRLRESPYRIPVRSIVIESMVDDRPTLTKNYRGPCRIERLQDDDHSRPRDMTRSVSPTPLRKTIASTSMPKRSVDSRSSSPSHRRLQSKGALRPTQSTSPSQVVPESTKYSEEVLCSSNIVVVKSTSHSFVAPTRHLSASSTMSPPTRKLSTSSTASNELRRQDGPKLKESSKKRYMDKLFH